MLVSAKEMLVKAKKGKYAVGQFNINNLEWTKAILLTAQENNSPVILGVSEGAGKYMCGYKTIVGMVEGMLNKPDGYISATFDKRDPIVLDLIDKEDLVFEPFPVGRLDKDTEGLLVLTNDGQLAHRVLSPKKHVPKTYYAKIEGIVTEEDIKAFAKGVTLDDGYETMPAELIILKSDEISEIELTIHEGKFHQVKRMFESVDKKVIYLKRLSMGKLKLDENLALGEYRELTDEEVKMIEERD